MTLDLTRRLVKGTPLTAEDHDDNIDKLEAGVESRALSSDARLTNSREWTASTISQVEAESRTATDRRAWTAERVGQAIAAWWLTASSSFGRTLASAADASAGRTALGLGTLSTQSGTFSGTSSGTNTGDQTIALTGEVTGSGTGSFAATVGNAAVIGKVLTGYTSGAGTVAATDTILQAIQKLNGNTAGLSSVYQPLDSDLTSIAALTTTTFGRSHLTLANAAAATAQLDAFTTSLKGLVPAPGTATGKVLSDSGSWVVLGGGGDALVANPLSQFAATTSAQLLGVISDETGTGSLVFATSPTLVTPNLGTPASGTLTNCTGLPVAGVTGLGAPPALGGTTPAAGTFTALEATTTLRLPSAAPGSPATRHLYPSGDTLRYRDSANAERLLLNATDNLANLASAAAARTNLGGVITASSTDTLINKTIGDLKETTFTITDAAAFEIDPANGPIQTVTLGANRTPAATSFTSGQSVKLKIDDGTTFAITWTTVGVVWISQTPGSSGTVPALGATGWTHIELWKEGSIVYGSLIGYTAT